MHSTNVKNNYLHITLPSDMQKAWQYDPKIHFHSSTTRCHNIAAGKYPIS